MEVLCHSGTPVVIVSVDCTSEELFANQELLDEFVPPNSQWLEIFDDESDEHGNVTVIMPMEYSELAGQIRSGVSRILAGQKVSRTWLN
jgi:hypothetical protein